MHSRLLNRIKYLGHIAGTILFLMACQPEKETPSIYTGNVSALSNQTFNSSVLTQQMKYNIILPGSYNLEPDKTYPILYLLHGMGDDNNAWMDKGDAKNLIQKAIKDNTIPEIIVVMPDAFVTFYANDYQDGLDYETYFQEEFMPFIESEYRVDAKRSSRFIAGLSMGGYGASYYAFSYPGEFAYCYSMSGALEGVGSASTPSIANLVSAFKGDFNSLPDYTIDCGTSDYLVYTSNVNTHVQLNQLGFEHEYIERNGTHDWTFWQEALPTALERIGSYLNE